MVVISFSAGDIEATLKINRDEFNKGLDQAKADADRFAGKPIKATVTADGTQAKATLDDLTARADKLSGKAGTIKVGADATQANTELDKTSAKVDALAKKFPTIKVQANTDQANAEMDKTGLKADALGKKTETVTVKADTSDASTKLDALSGKLTKLTKQLQEKSGPIWLGPALAGLPAATDLIGATAGAVAGLGGAFATAGAAAVAFGAVAKPVITQATAANKAAATAQAAYTASVAKTTGAYQIAMGVAKTRAQQIAAHAKEQKGFAADRLAETQAQSKAYAGMSTQQIALAKQLGDMSAAWKNVQAAQTPVIAGALEPWLKTITSLTSDLAPIIGAVAPVIHDLGVKMNDVVTSPGFQTFVGFIAGTGSTALNSIGSTLTDLMDSFILLAPKFTPLIDQASAGIASFGANVLAWAQSKQASDDITKFIGWFATNGPAAWTLIKNLGGALAALSPGLTSGGMLEIKTLSTFLGWIAALPKGVAAPLEEIVGALLLASKLGVLRLGVSLVTKGSKLLGLLTGTAKTSTVEIASAGMTSAADTMLQASLNMLRAAGLEDTAGVGGGAKTGEGASAAGGAAGLAGGLLSVAALAAIALVVLDQIKVPGGGSVLRPKQSDLGVGGTWWKDIFGGDQKPAPKPSPAARGGKAIPATALLRPKADAGSTAWQEYNKDFIDPVEHWIDITVPQTFTRAIPGWFASIWNDFYRDAVAPVANWVTVSLPAAFTRSIPRWFTGVWADFSRDVVAKIAAWVTVSLPHFFTDTVPRWFDLAGGAFAGKVVTPVRNFVTVTLPGFFTKTIPHWFDLAAGTLAAKVVAPSRTFVMTTLPGFFTRTIPHWFDTAVASLTGKVIAPVRTFILSTLPGFFASTIPHWFDRFGAVLHSGIIAPITAFFQGLPSIIKGAFVSALNWVIGKINNVTAHIPLVGKSLSIPTISGAGGGVLPGYAPGQDTLYARLSPGEGILVPEAVQAVGPGWVTGMNAKYGHGRKSEGMAYAGGGIHLPGVVSSAIHGAESIGSAVLKEAGRMVSGALESGFNTIWSKSFAPIEKTMAGDGMGGKLTAAAMAQFLAGADSFLGAKDAASNDSVGGGSGSDVAAFAKSFATGQNHPYVTGGQGPSGWDCSGFSAYVYEKFGYFPGADKVRHGTSESQFSDPLLQGSGAQAGALVFFDDGFYANPGHVGIMINSSNYAGADSHAVGTVIAPASGAVGYRVPKGGFVSSSPGKGNLIANAASIGNYLLGHGANKIAAAGIMGNMLQESGGAWQAPGGGLIQITGAHPSSLAQSLAQTIAYIHANGGMGPINASYNVPMATELFMNQYERPAAATENLARRLAGAAAAYAAGYDSGGWLQPGTTMAVNNTGRPELVVSGDQLDALSKNGPSGRAGGQLANTINITLPEGGTVADAFSELTFRLRAAQQQSWTGGNPYG